MKAIGFVVAGAILIGLAAPASAAIFNATYTGLTMSVSDPDAIFGAGASSRQMFTLTFTYDTQNGVDDSVPGTNAVFKGSGGETATLSFNNHSDTIADDKSAPNFIQQSAQNAYFGFSIVGSGLGYANAELHRFDLTIPLTYDTAFSTDLLDGNGFSDGSFQDGSAVVVLAPTSFSLSASSGPVSPVPLPPALPLFGAALV